MPHRFLKCAQKIENLRKPIKAAPFPLPAPGIIRAAMAGKPKAVVALVQKPIESLVDEEALQQSAKAGQQLGREVVKELG